MATITYKSDADALADAQAAKLSDLRTAYEEDAAAVKAGYPASEVLSWDKQEREARAYQADATAATPFLDALAAERQIDKAELVSRIMAKVADYEAYVGTLTGKRQRLEDAVNAATTEAEVAAIIWSKA